MRIRFVDTLNILGVRGHTNKFEDDSHLGIILLIKAEDALDYAEPTTERIVLNFRQNDIVNASWMNLRVFCDLEFGRPLITVATSARFGIFIPFYHPDLPNAINKRMGDNMDLYVDALAISPTTSGYCDVYSVMDEVPEFYVPSLISYVETAKAGVTNITLEIDNIAQLLVFAPATTNQTLLQFFVDNDLQYSGTFEVLTVFSNIIARIEAAALGVVVFDLIVRGQINEALNNRSRLESTGGVGLFDYMTQTLQFSPSISIATYNNVVNFINWQLRKKANQGKLRGVQVSDMYDGSGIVSARTRLTMRRRPEAAELTPELEKAERTEKVP